MLGFVVTALAGWVTAAVDQSHDPSGAPLQVHFLAIGDWGATVAKAGRDSSCCSQYSVNATGANVARDRYAQANLATLMAQSAQLNAPHAVLAHGDSFYWNGVGPDAVETAYRFDQTFEAIYNHPSLINVPWLNVMGNHDYGGSGYDFCMDAVVSDAARFICGNDPCNSTAAIRHGLQLKFQAQHSYKSPAADRWRLDHVFKATFRRQNVSVDVLNVDTNGHADVHGANHICCQCYGYLSQHPRGQESPNVCANPEAGQPLCAGGSVEMHAACMDELTGYANKSLAFVKAEAATQADWKIANSHFAPHYHMPSQWQAAWLEALQTAHVLVHGHTHGANHVKVNSSTGRNPLHMIENGAGGGMVPEAGHRTAPRGMELMWVAPGTPYGFFELAMSKSWLRVQFVTFDSRWKFAPPQKGGVVGGRAVVYSAWIPHPSLEMRS